MGNVLRAGRGWALTSSGAAHRITSEQPRPTDGTVAKATSHPARTPRGPEGHKPGFPFWPPRSASLYTDTLTAQRDFFVAGPTGDRGALPAVDRCLCLVDPNGGEGRRGDRSGGGLLHGVRDPRGELLGTPGDWQADRVSWRAARAARAVQGKPHCPRAVSLRLQRDVDQTRRAEGQSRLVRTDGVRNADDRHYWFEELKALVPPGR